MIALLQRVTMGSVSIDGVETARIASGLLVLVGVERDDGADEAGKLAARMLGYRIFDDAQGRMNRDVVAAGGGLLLVPQFTLAADTRSGRRPGFSTAASPAQARTLFEAFVTQCRDVVLDTVTGTFGAHMQVASINDGPVTFQLRCPAAGSA